MRRDLKLIRDIMLVMETSPEVVPPLNWREQLASLGWEEDVVVQEHTALLIEAGLLAGSVHRDTYRRQPHVYVLRITHEGHDFLDAARADEVWFGAMERLDAIGGSASLELLRDVLAATARDKLGLTS